MRLRKYIAFAGMAVLMLCSCNEMENAPTNKFTDNSYWTSTTKSYYYIWFEFVHCVYSSLNSIK